MAKRKSNTIRLGLFVIIGFVLFTYAVFRIGERQEFFGGTFLLYTNFEDVQGLQVGNNVRFSGITIGGVEEITIVSDTCLRVTMSVSAEVKDYLRANAVTSIGSDGLVGNKIVNIRPGNGTAPLVQQGDELQSAPQFALNEMANSLSSTNDRIVAISLQLLDITEKINQGQGSMALLLNDQEMAVNLKAATNHLQQMTSSLSSSSRALNDMLAQSAQGEGNLGYLLRDSSLQDQVEDLSDNLNSLFVDQTGPILDKLQLTASSLVETSSALENMITQIDQNEGLLGTMLGDTSVANNLKNTMESLDDGMAKFSENMEALQHHWLFRGYFRKQARREERAARNEE